MCALLAPVSGGVGCHSHTSGIVGVYISASDEVSKERHLVTITKSVKCKCTVVGTTDIDQVSSLSQHGAPIGSIQVFSAIKITVICQVHYVLWSEL